MTFLFYKLPKRGHTTITNGNKTEGNGLPIGQNGWKNQTKRENQTMKNTPIYNEEPAIPMREETVEEMLARLCLPDSEINELLSEADHLFDKAA